MSTGFRHFYTSLGDFGLHSRSRLHDSQKLVCPFRLLLGRSATNKQIKVTVCRHNISGGTNTSDTAMVSTESPTSSQHHCKVPLQHPHHGQRVHVVVTCRNRVQLVSFRTSSDTVVLLDPPDMSQVVLSLFGLYCSFEISLYLLTCLPSPFFFSCLFTYVSQKV